MKYIGFIACVILAFGSGCAGQPALTPAAGYSWQPLYGSSNEGVEVRTAGKALTLSFSIAAGPRFGRVALPDNVAVSTGQWSGQTTDALTLSIPQAGTVDVAVVPLA